MKSLTPLLAISFLIGCDGEKGNVAPSKDSIEEATSETKPPEAVSVNPNLKYVIKGDTVTITDCDEAATGELVIPDTIGGNPVTSIGERAFDQCGSLTSITIPDSVTRIGSGAFFGCTSLTSITIGNGVTSIGKSAFTGCTSLTSITIGNGVTSIGDAAFGSCTNLTSFIFKGDAPTVAQLAFSGVAAGAVAYVTREALSSFGDSGDNWNGLSIQLRDGNTNPAPLPEIRTAIEFSFDAANGVSYRIEASTDLINWEMIETAIIGEGIRIDRFYSTRDQPNRHFRVKTN